MPATEPENLADIGWDGNTEETAVTNDPENAGFPARSADGGLVFVMKTRYVDQTKVLIDADGREWVDFAPTGALVPYTGQTQAEKAVAQAGGDPEAAPAEEALTEEEVAADEDDESFDSWEDNGGAAAPEDES